MSENETDVTDNKTEADLKGEIIKHSEIRSVTGVKYKESELEAKITTMMKKEVKAVFKVEYK